MAMSWITSLPEDIIIECVARVPRRYYPTLSLVSKFFRSLIASPELYARRSLLDRTECCLYVTILTHNDGCERLYSLRQKINSDGGYCLVPITSLPPMHGIRSCVAVGSKIYVIGGTCDEVSSNALTLIDCPFHTVHHHLPNMPTGVNHSVSGYINEKLYVIGRWFSQFSRLTKGPLNVMVFDINSETWESKKRPENVVYNLFSKTTVMWDDKIYFRISNHVFVYDPGEDKMEKDKSFKMNACIDSDCVIDGVLYYYAEFPGRLESYNLKERCRKTVKGVIELSADSCPRTVRYDKNVVVLFEKYRNAKTVEVWCAEIKLERDEQGEVCARLEWCDCVFEGPSSHFMKCLVVKV